MRDLRAVLRVETLRVSILRSARPIDGVDPRRDIWLGRLVAASNGGQRAIPLLLISPSAQFERRRVTKRYGNRRRREGSKGLRFRRGSSPEPEHAAITSTRTNAINRCAHLFDARRVNLVREHRWRSGQQRCQGALPGTARDCSNSSAVRAVLRRTADSVTMSYQSKITGTSMNEIARTT